MTLNITHLAKPPEPWPTDDHGSWLRPMPLAALRCPLCGEDVIWGLASGNGATSSANCANGRTATRIGAHLSPPCEWAGTPIYRHDGHVFVAEPVATRRVGEARQPWEVT